MDFELSPEQRRLRADIVAFARAELGQQVADDDQAGRFPWADWRRCAEFGVLGWPIPQEYGGSGFDPLTTVVALEALGYGCRDNGLVFAVNNHLWGCAIYLMLHGTPEQKEQYLRPLAAGSLIGAHALSEEQAGSDVLAVATTAKRDGDGYRLDGSKCFVSNGPVADVFVVMARTGERTAGQNHLSAFIVTSDMPGVAVRRELPKMGLRTAPMGEVSFDGTPVPAANLLGAEGAGYRVFASTIDWERAFMFAPQVGAMERLLEASIRHARSRHQFGQAIGGFQAVSHQVADMKIRLELARTLLYKVGWLKREGRLALLETTMAKVFVSDSLVQTAQGAMTIHGARGYLAGDGFERELRDALGGPIYGGTNAVQRGVLAELLGVPGALHGSGSR
ncbi:acyl-CoA dehydrogenase family protein [Actinoplanes oblitus]|uniref:Acyl-CoA dehydrogenase family protein n=1 Tax=Actinoplanes oblitus TaxID=3040509 RepID=A0ABY8WAL9_9ACTN|nr:acyl-CoA dehydrogenase family protein [Actinoplanes oblitus]WIM94412.1 acyl-CoA dehydrogenase family protein [Actinoplanes oblitus]